MLSDPVRADQALRGPLLRLPGTGVRDGHKHALHQEHHLHHEECATRGQQERVGELRESAVDRECRVAHDQHCQVRAPPGLVRADHTDQDEGVSAGGGGDEEARGPALPPGDEVPQQAGRVLDRLDHGQLASVQRDPVEQ